MDPIYLLVAILMLAGLGLALLITHVVKESLRATERSAELLGLLMQVKRAELQVPEPLAEAPEPLFARPLPPRLENYIAALEDEQAQVDQREYFQHKLAVNPELEPDDLLTEALRF
jgi:hypothetical protein